MAYLAGALEIKLFTDIARLQSDMNKANQTVDRAMGNIEKSVNVAKRALGGLFAGVGVATIINTVDAYKRFDSQLKLATKSAGEYAEAYANVVRISKASQSDIGAVGVLYARLTNNLRDFGTSQKEISTITEAVSLSLRVSNATVQETNSVMLQLSQSFGSGKINGQEFLAVSEGAPIIMRQLAKSLKVTYGELKELSTQGKLTAEVLKTALSDPAYIESLREQAKVVGTISSALQVAKNAFTQYIGEADKGQGTSKLLSQGIILLAENINNLVTVAIAGAIVSFGRFTQTKLASMAATTASIAADNLKLASERKILLSQVVLREAQLAGIVATNASSLAIGNNAALATRAAVADTALTAAKTKLAAATTTAGVAARGFGSAVAFLGGPIGALITALGLAYLAFEKFGKKSSPIIDAIKEKVIQLNFELAKTPQALAVAAETNFAALGKQREILQKELDARVKYQQEMEKNGSVRLLGGSANKDRIGVLEQELNATLAVYQDFVKQLPEVAKKAKTALEKLPEGVKLLSAQIKEQQEIMRIAKVQLDATGISQSDYNNIVSEAKKRINDLTGATKANAAANKAAAKEQSEAYKEGLKAIQETIENEQILIEENGRLAQQLATEYTEALNDSKQALMGLVAAEEASIAKMQEEIDLLGKGSQYLTDMEVARLRDAAAAYEQNAAMAIQIGLSKENIEYLKQQAKGLNELADAKASAEEVKSRLNSFKLDKEQADNRIKEAERATKEIAEEAKRAGESIYNSISDSIVRSLETGKGSFKTFLKSLVNQAKAQIIRIGVDFFMQGSGLKGIFATLGGVVAGLKSGGANAGGGAGASEVLNGTGSNSILGQLSGIKDIFSAGNASIVSGIESLGTFLSTGTGGLGDLVGGALGQYAGTIANVLPYAGAALQLLKGDFKGAALTAIGTAIGGPIGGAIGAVVGSFLGKKKITRFGSTVSGTYDGTEYKDKSRSKFYDKDLGAGNALSALNKQFSESFAFFLKGFDLKSVFSISSSQYQRGKSKKSGGMFSGEINGNTFGGSVMGRNLSGQAVFDMLTEKMLGEGLASAIRASDASAGIKKFFATLTKKEDVADAINTLVGLNRQLGDLPKVFNAIRNAMDTTSYETSIADLKTRFAAIGTYTSLFYTAEEQFATFTQQLSSQLGALDTALPQSRDEYRKLVDGINVTDEATSGLFNGLVALAPAMDAYFKQLEEQKAQVDALAKSMDSLRTEELFKTLFDFKRYTGVAENYGSDFANRYVDNVLPRRNLPSFASGSNMLPNDMVAQVHAGERIVPAADNKAIIQALNGGGDLKQLIRDLIIEVRSGNISMVQAAQKTAKVMQRIDDEGVMINETNNAGVRTVLNVRTVA